MIETLVWAPLTAGLVAALLPGRFTGWVATLGPLASLIVAIALFPEA